MTLNLRMTGAKKVIAKLKAAHAKIERNKDRATRSAATIVARAMRREAPKAQPSPYSRPPGTLRKSIRVRKLPGEGYVVKPGPLGHLVVKGTAAHDFGPKAASVLRFSVAGQDVFSQAVHHPGTKANPFVGRAFDLLTREEAIAAAKTVLRGGAEVGDIPE
jgi:Bacteriophage HK97-gp10, putative tail-component